MKLSESYKKRIKTLSGIILENSTSNEYEYQVRNIGGDVFYRRKKGDKKWEFIDELEFYKNSNKNNILTWENKEPKKQTIKNLKILENKEDVLKFYKIYYENISPSNFKVELIDDFIKVTKK
tara:strand:- start:235 stop:600 length:366 start_codon:yes stop_codon:yes gene_type:complete